MLSNVSYVCNLIAGNKYITNLYFAVDRARDLVNKDNRMQRFDKKISFPSIGSKVYSSSQLINFENLSYSLSYQCILNEIENNTPTLEQYIILLLKGRNAIRGLYQACCRANFIKEQEKVFCYTFNNPFGSLAGVNRDKLQFKGANNFLQFFCQCETRAFNPKLVFNGIYNIK